MIEGTLLSMSINLVIFSSTYLFSDFLVHIFTNDSRIYSLAYGVVPYFCVEAVFDCLQALLSGALRGLGLVGAAYTSMLLWQWLIYLPIVVGVAIVTY